jgi:hypothetical protein
LRGFELVIKISLTLAIPSQLRTLEYVEWAFEFVKKDLVNKSNLAEANTATEENRHGDALFRRIIGLLDEKIGMTTGVILNRLRKYKKEDIKTALSKLKDANDIITKKSQNKKGTKTELWFLP